MNLKNLGREQRNLLRRIANEDLIISVLCEDGKKDEIDLESEDGENTFSLIYPKEFNALVNRRLFDMPIIIRPSLGVWIGKYRLCEEAKEFFKDQK